MGVASSLQNNTKNYEPPPLPPPFYTGGYLSGTSRASLEQPIQNIQTDDPRIRASLRNDEWWQQRPAPSASNLRQPRETLLTYAAQMTGWQSEYTPSAPSVQQEAMELTKTVAHLAAANQQLATAHNLLLGQLERLYIELNKEKELKTSLQELRSHSALDDDLIRRIEAIESIIQGGSNSSESAKVRNVDEKSYKSFLQMRGRHMEQKKEEDRKAEYQKTLERIQILENELQPPGRDEVGCGKDETFSNEDRVSDLLKEISRLKADQLERQEESKKLVNELEKQKMLVERLRRDCEISKNHSIIVESRLNDKEEEINQSKRDFDLAKFEILKLTKELDAFHEEKDTTTSGIKNLDRDLRKAEHAREETITLVGEESWRLRIKLEEELRNKKKQHKAFEESLREIQRLNDIIDVMKKEEKCNDRVLDTERSTDTDALLERPKLEEFKKDLSMKREARQRAIAAVSSEMDRLRRELDAEKEAHSETSRVLDLLKSQADNASRKSETFSVGTTTNNTDNWRSPNEWQENPVHLDVQRLTDVLKVSDELRACIRVQIEKVDDLRYHLECDPDTNASRIDKLKDVANSSREFLNIREEQLNTLKNILSTTIARLGDDKYRIEVTDDLRTEHNRQLDDIRNLKSLYDERIRIIVDLKDTYCKELVIVKHKLKNITKEKEMLDEDFAKADEKIDVQQTEIVNLESQLGLTKADCRDLQNQMSVINGLFSQMLLSASSADMDLDRLTQLLQENHDLISEMAREEGTEAAALPKLLLDLVEQVEGREKSKSDGDSENLRKEEDQQEENIAHNLPKVWRVLLELLSCHAARSTSTSSNLLSTDPNVCYKSVDTPAGPRLVISVSKTYIRLKELILEKKHLVKEMGRLKQLNCHLESKLGEQEKRLSTISDELSKTWNIVGRMQAQHQQLHTHETILRYELQQKRKMLQELKQELEYCREKWESARQKNTNTEVEWRNLRREFAARKALAVDDSFNNSAESGFSDERGDDTDEDDMPGEERLRISPRRRTRKESPRTPTPDTESDHPTDNESSDIKTSSTVSNASEQRISTPDIAQNDQLIIIEEDIPEQRIDFDPLDQALANVIHNLINTDGARNVQNERTRFDSHVEEVGDSSQTEDLCNTKTDNFAARKAADTAKAIKTADITEATETINSASVFSIGPFPSLSTSSSYAAPGTTNDEELIENNEISSVLVSPVFGLSSQKESTEPRNEIIKTNETSTTEIATDLPTVLSENKADVAVERVTELPSSSSPSSSTPASVSATTVSVLATATSISVTSAAPSTSTTTSSQSRAARSPEEVLAARSARLKRLEEQADWLMKKMNATSQRGSTLSTRLEELHEVYGEPPAPPPLPDVLPSIRLPTDLNTNQENDTHLPEDTS